MHIVYVCADPEVPVFGSTGASVRLLQVVRIMAREHRVTVIAGRKGGKPPPDLADLAVLTLPSTVGRDAAEREQAARLAAAAVPGLIADAEKMQGPAGLIVEQYSVWSTGGMRAALARGIPGIVEVSAPLIDEQVRRGQLRDRVGAERVATTVFTDAAVMIAASPAVAAWVKERSPTPWRVRVLPAGVAVDRFRPRETRPRRPFTVGFVGSLTAAKGVDLLVAALCRMAEDTRLLIVGDGPELQPLRRAAEPLDARVVFTGALPVAAVPAALAQMDVTVAPYRPTAAEATPTRVLEYMAAGTAVVASAVRPLPSLIEDGRTGLLVPPGDVDALVEALERLRDEPAVRRALGAEARRSVCEHHTMEQMVQALFAIAGVGAQRVITLPAEDKVPLR
jgi:glycosyltransferase involved in cell wall biosynthesis